jgi:hypothetical protein
LRQRRKLTIYHDLEVGGCVLGLPFGVLQLLLQVGRLPFFAHHGLLDKLDLPRGLDLGLQLCLMGCGGLCMRISRFPQ